MGILQDDAPHYVRSAVRTEEEILYEETLKHLSEGPNGCVCKLRGGWDSHDIKALIDRGIKVSPFFIEEETPERGQSGNAGAAPADNLPPFLRGVYKEILEEKGMSVESNEPQNESKEESVGVGNEEGTDDLEIAVMNALKSIENLSFRIAELEDSNTKKWELIKQIITHLAENPPGQGCSCADGEGCGENCGCEDNDNAYPNTRVRDPRHKGDGHYKLHF